MSLLSPSLQAFVAIAQHKTVHAAAQALHLTQTAVTQRIRGLEANLKTTLFIRSRRGMLLTPEAEALLRYCHAAQDLEGEVLAKIEGAGVTSTIQVDITGPSSIMSSRIIPQCMPVMQSFPNLLMKFTITDFSSRVQELRNGTSQFAILAQEDVASEMDHKLLHAEKYVLVCSAQWKGRKLQEVIKNERIVDFDPTDQMTFHYLKHYDLFDLAHHERHFVNRIEALAMLVVAGYGYGLLTKELAKAYVDRGELMVLNGGKIYEYVPALAWYQRPEAPPYFAALIAAIQ